jgi:hypothetical protein
MSLSFYSFSCFPFHCAYKNNSSTVVSYLDGGPERSQVAIAVVYCDYGDPRTRSEVDILSSLTRQLAEKCRPLPRELKAFRERYVRKMTRPTTEEHVALVRSLTRLFKKTYIFIDALVMSTFYICVGKSSLLTETLGY